MRPRLGSEPVDSGIARMIPTAKARRPRLAPPLWKREREPTGGFLAAVVSFFSSSASFFASSAPPAAGEADFLPLLLLPVVAAFFAFLAAGGAFCSFSSSSSSASSSASSSSSSPPSTSKASGGRYTASPTLNSTPSFLKVALRAATPFAALALTAGLPLARPFSGAGSLATGVPSRRSAGRIWNIPCCGR